MASRKKYIYVLFVLSISLYSLPVMSAEFMYGAIPAQEVAEVTRSFSEILKDNPIIMPVIAGITAATVLFCGRHKILGAGKKRYERFTLFVGDKCTVAQDTISKELDIQIKKLPVWFQPAVIPLRTLFGYMFNGVINYGSDNKKFIAGAFLLHGIGYVSGHQYSCDIAAGGCLTAGYFKSIFDEYDKRNEARHQASMKEHAVTQEKIDIATQNINNLDSQLVSINNEMKKLDNSFSAKLEKTEQALSSTIVVATAGVEKKIDNLDNKMSGKIQEAGAQLEIVNKQLETIPVRFDELATDIKTIRRELHQIRTSKEVEAKHNEALMRETQKLSSQLKDATKSLTTAENTFSSLVVKLTGEIHEETKKTTEELKKLKDQGDKSEEKMGEILEKITCVDELLHSLENIQQQDSKRVNDLLPKIDQILTDRISKKEFWDTIMEIHTKNDEALSVHRSNIEVVQEEYRKVISGMYFQMKEEVAVLNTKVTNLEQNTVQLAEKVDHNHIDLSGKVQQNTDGLNIVLKKLEEAEKRNLQLEASLAKAEAKHTKSLKKMSEKFSAAYLDLARKLEHIEGQNNTTHDMIQQKKDPRITSYIPEYSEVYPLSVSVNSPDFPTGKKLLFGPKVHARQQSLGRLELPAINFTNPKK